MATNRYTESFLPCMPQIARQILAAGIANERNMRELQEIAAEQEKARDYLCYEVSRADGRVSATIYVRLDEAGRRSRDEMLDDDGNEWLEYRARFDVFWPSHGTTTLAQAAARVELYDELVRLAVRLQAEFGDRPIMHLYRAAAKIAEDKAKAEAAKAQRAVEALAKDGMLANLRVGGISGMRSAGEIPAGDYQISNGRKRFTVRIVRNTDGNMMALASRIEDAAE
ncbi:MAG: hypothetical protein KGK07_14750 [Chloroflexota bacterium]|nr:hypothetical protein [Chloroflexota bacterium]